MLFSNILDISSFFIGMLINLLLIALICYYFKRKYETLEMAQNEQAKILYNLIQQQNPRKQFNIEELMNSHVEQINLDNRIVNETKFDSDADTDSDSDSDSGSEPDIDDRKPSTSTSISEIKKIILLPEPVEPKVEPKVKEIESIEVEVEVEVVADNEVENYSHSGVNADPDDYSKMTIKQLKDILSKKGISSNNKMKKNELIQLIETGTPGILNLSEELSEVNI